MDYATISDITALFRPLTQAETDKATALLPIVSDRLRVAAVQVGKDLDEMIARTPGLRNVAKQVTVDVVARTLMTPTETGQGVMSQMSESALGYSVSGSFLNPGGGLFVKDSELRALGIKRQQIGAMEIYANTRYNSYPVQPDADWDGRFQ